MKPLTYSAAGVNIAKGEALVAFIKKAVRRLRPGGLVSGVGGFGAVTRVPVRHGRAPLLVSGTDGVGTKLKVAFKLDRHDTVGIDLVAMSVNDVVVQGARPAFFLDYLAMGRLDLRVAKQIIRGIVEGCRRAECALIGGETAELSGLYRKGEYDLAGFCVGTVEERDLIDGRDIRPGDAVLGIGSMGLHSNGYSLALRLLLELKKLPLGRVVPELGCPLGEELLRPTRIYVRTVLNLMKAVPVLGLAHITGGGLPGNALRPLPRGLGLRLRRGSWPVLPVFRLIQRLGRVREAEMFRTFNMGLGLVAIVNQARVDEALKCLLDGGDRAHVVGTVTRSGRFELAG
ncbi:MAG: phosphoribosylformylglycinamidine cyclo-ligase [bacterium]